VIDLSVPLAGVAAAELSLNHTAAKAAQSGFSGGGDSVDLSEEAVGLQQARSSVAANVKVARTEDQMMGSLVNLLG
jgi:flagellar hook protein FlgE